MSTIPLLEQVGVCKNPKACTDEEKNQNMIKWLHSNSDASRATYFNATGFSGCDLTTYAGVDQITNRPKPQYVSLMISNIDNHYPANFHAMFPSGKTGLPCVVYGKKGDTAATFIENNREDYLNKHCSVIYHLEPGIEGLLDNYTLFTTKNVIRDDGSSDEIFLPHGFNSPEECHSFIQSDIALSSMTSIETPQTPEITTIDNKPLGM